MYKDNIVVNFVVMVIECHDRYAAEESGVVATTL